jgi:orotate phosphoribosyltransferase
LERLLENIQDPSSSTPSAHPIDGDILAYAEGDLPIEELRRVHDHLVACTHCTSRLDHFRREAMSWEGPEGDQRLDALTEKLHSVFIDTERTLSDTHLSYRHREQEEISFPDAGLLGDGVTSFAPTLVDRQVSERARSILATANAIESTFDYALPCGLHSDVHINIGKLCCSEHVLSEMSLVLEYALRKVAFDTIVSTGWTMATLVRRLLLRWRRDGRRVQHVSVEGYPTPRFLEDVLPKSNAFILTDVVVTGQLVGAIVEELKSQGAKVVGALSLVQARGSAVSLSIPLESLSSIQMDLSPPERCQRCGVLSLMEFNPVAYRMTIKKQKPRSPSAFLEQDADAREFWHLVDVANAYEHHRTMGKRHYIGFVDTAKLLTNPDTRDFVATRLSQRIVSRIGVPDVVLVPPRARAELLGKRLVTALRTSSDAPLVRLQKARREGGHLVLPDSVDIDGRCVLIADAAAGYGNTLDELALLASDRGAAVVAAATLLSRLSEGCEQALDERLGGGFTYLYSLPVRPITVHDRRRSQCPACRRRSYLHDTIATLPKGGARDLAKQLEAVKARFRGRKREISRSRAIPTQIALFPLQRCRRGVASGIALHALHASMGDGMAPLVLPELRDPTIPARNKAAILEDLPPTAVLWSGEALREDLRTYLNTSKDSNIWEAVANLLTQAGLPLWIDCLAKVLPKAGQQAAWMDERFWATMICNTHELLSRSPRLREEVRPRLERLVVDHDGGVLVGRGLKGMLEAADANVQREHTRDRSV